MGAGGSPCACGTFDTSVSCVNFPPKLVDAQKVEHARAKYPAKRTSWISVCFSWMLYMVIVFVFFLVRMWSRLTRFVYRGKAPAVRRIEWPEQPPREDDKSRLVIVRGILMSTPADPSGLVPMPWEHCAAAIESSDNKLQNGGAIIARISCVGSAHDRSCELFAFLTGTQV